MSFCGPKAAPPGVPLEREWRSPDGASYMRLSVPSEGTADLFHRGELGRALLNGTSLDSGREAQVTLAARLGDCWDCDCSTWARTESATKEGQLTKKKMH